jgi:ABC-2 type transport system permease protein
MRTLRLAAVFARVVVMNEIQYRANFFLQILQSLVALGIGLVVLGLVLSYVDDLRGWTGPQLLAVLGTYTIMGGFVRVVLRPNLIRLMEDVREGTLDYVLTKPVDAQVLVSIRMVHIWHGVDVLIGAAVLMVAVAGMDGGLSVPNVLGFLVCLVLGALMIYSLLTALASAAFLFIRVEPILELFDGVYQAGRWPIGIYPGWLRMGLTFVVPIGVAVTVPSEALTGRLSGAGLLGFVGLAAALFLGTRLVWKAGLRRYSGASA